MLSMNQSEMIQVIHLLAAKCNQLERKVDDLAKWVTKERNKINVLEWLSLQPDLQPDYVFSDLFHHLVIQERHVDIVKQNNLIECLDVLFTESFQDKKIPVRALTHKPGHLYVYDPPNPDLKELLPASAASTSAWRESKNPEWIVLCNQIQKTLLGIISEWKKKHRTVIDRNDKICEEYNRTMMKLLISFQDESTLNKIKRILFEIVKMEIRKTSEYEVI